MADIEDIGWGSYRNYEGPFHRGKHPFKLRMNSTEDEKILAVVTATEGGHYDAINMYDGPPILSSCLIQFIEGKGVRGVSQVIGEALRGSPHGEKFRKFLHSIGCVLSASDGKWYLHDDDGANRVDTTGEQEMLFRYGCNGEKGTWTADGSLRAKRWAAAVATLWEDEWMQFQQVKYTVPKLRQFCFGFSRNVVNAADGMDNPYARAFVAAYISFAVNNPTRANRHLTKVRDSCGGFTWDWNEEGLVNILKELTFGPKIAIYPHRYNAIRPVLEKLYGINLPDFAEELKTWTEETGFRFCISTEELQMALMALGEDLGPHGADGQYGKKTKAALLNVELRHGVPREFCDGMIDEHTYPVLEKALLDKGRADLTMPTLKGVKEQRGELEEESQG